MGLTAAHEHAGHDQEIRSWILHLGADLVDEREDDERGDGVGYERRDHEDQGGEDDEDGVEGEPLDFGGDGVGDGVEEAG